MKKLLLLMCFIIFTVGLFAQRNVNVDFGVNIGAVKDLMGVNKGPIGYESGYKEIGITSVRTHDFQGACDYPFYTQFWNYDTVGKKFLSINPNFDPNNSNHYSWKETDKYISSIINNGCDVYFRLGISWPQPAFDIPQPIAPPLDPDGQNFTKFATLCKRTIMHFNDGWNSGKQYGLKYFEIWNEPDGIFWSGTSAQYFKLYKTVYDTLKKYNSNLKIGAPGCLMTTTLGITSAYLDGLLSYIKNNNCGIDFYSWHIYGTKNPYGIKIYADTIRAKLNRYGFTNAESHISEINDALNAELETLSNSAKGAAYYLSHLIMAQNSSIDKIFWYQGTGFFKTENNSVTPKWAALGLKAYTLFKNHSPIQIKSSGDDVIEGNYNKDTTNMAILAGKSADGNKVALLISNLKSGYSSFKVTLANLPWKSSDSIRITTNIIAAPDSRLKETVQRITGGPTINAQLGSYASPSVILVRFEKIVLNRILENNSPSKTVLYQNYPNPFNPSTKIFFSMEKSGQVLLKIYNSLGQEISTLVNEKKEAGNHNIEWNPENLPTGIYFYRLEVIGNNYPGNVFSETRKLLLIK